MVENRSGSSEFPVTLFDGEKEINIGNVKINSTTMDYKSFQLILSQKIGISSNQISIYLIDRKKSAKSPVTRIPITGKVNFGSICRQKDSSFLVVLKRSRKSRIRTQRIVNGDHDSMMLRRDQTTPFYYPITDLNDRIGVDDPHYVGVDLNQYDLYYSGVSTRNSMMMMMTKNEMKKAFCEECVNEKRNGGKTASFHLCVNDAVISLFTSRVGPIDRPNEELNSLTDLGFFLEDI